MIKLVIFDLDGVLVDTKQYHYLALNSAIEKVAGLKYIITESEHISTYDGLPTKAKLKLLTEKKKLNPSHYDSIWYLKQQETFKVLESNIKKNPELIKIIDHLKNNNVKVYIASNSIRETIDICVKALGIDEMIDGIYSNTDISFPKPNGQMYLSIIAKEGVSPKETLIAEDSSIGREAVNASCANLLPINEVTDLTFDYITSFISKLEQNISLKPTWIDNKMNILIPMAGAGSRFANAGYTFPKPLIEVNGKPMIHSVVESLGINANYIYLVRSEHYDKYNLEYLLKYITQECKIVKVDSLTEGAACTTLLARDHINNENPLLIVNSDQIVEWNSSDFMYMNNTTNIDGSILTFESTHPKWSYVKLDENGYVTDLAEKKVISNIATVGIYYWKKGSEYIKYAEQMIDKNIRVNNEFYVAPVYNEAISDNKKIKIFNVEKMHAIGTPEDLNEYLSRK